MTLARAQNATGDFGAARDEHRMPAPQKAFLRTMIVRVLLPFAFAFLASRALASTDGVPRPSVPAEGSGERAAGAPTPVILDCDPGLDDIMAIWWLISAHKQGVIRLAAVSTVAGNSDSRTVHRNAAVGALFFDALREEGIPFGRSGSLSEDEEDHNPSDGFFGADGMGNLSNMMLQESSLRERDLPKHRDARESAALIVETIEGAADRSVVLIAIGPLTNLALAEKIRPGILSRAKEVIVMGGGLGLHGAHMGLDGYSARGNVKAMAEFNFWADAASAKEVLDVAGKAVDAPNLVLVPLDVTQQLCWDAEENRRLGRAVRIMSKGAEEDEGRNVVIRLLHEMVERMEEPLVERVQRCLYLHDPSAIGMLLYPHLFHIRRLHVDVGTEGDFVGHTYTDVRPTLQDNPNAWVAVGVEARDFMMAMRRDFALLALSVEDTA